MFASNRMAYNNPNSDRYTSIGRMFALKWFTEIGDCGDWGSNGPTNGCWNGCTPATPSMASTASTPVWVESDARHCANDDTNSQLRDFTISSKDEKAFKTLLEEQIVRDFLNWDSCYLLADKYLLATAFAYFKKANFKQQQYTPCNLFVALYLAHDMQEDMDMKYDLIRFAMSNSLSSAKMKLFLRKRDKLWHALDFRAGVSHVTCNAIMKYCLPNHAIWRRERAVHHGGVCLPTHVRNTVIRELKLTNSYVECHIQCIVCVARRHTLESDRRNYALAQNKSTFLSHYSYPHTDTYYIPPTEVEE